MPLEVLIHFLTIISLLPFEFLLRPIHSDFLMTLNQRTLWQLQRFADANHLHAIMITRWHACALLRAYKTNVLDSVIIMNQR